MNSFIKFLTLLCLVSLCLVKGQDVDATQKADSEGKVDDSEGKVKFLDAESQRAMIDVSDPNNIRFLQVCFQRGNGCYRNSDCCSKLCLTRICY